MIFYLPGRGIPMIFYLPPCCPPTGGTVGDSTPPHPLDPMHP